MKRIVTAVFLFVAIAPAMCRAEQTTDETSIELTLPGELYAVPGIETGVYFDNIVLTKSPEKFRFEVTCDLGTVDKRSWTITPTGNDVGAHPLSITVTTSEGQPVATGEMLLQVVPADAGAGREIRLLIVGDSLTHATLYPNEIDRLFQQPGNPRVSFLGTHQPAQAAPGVAHEGYGGWTWQRFVSHYEPMPDGTYRKRSSPFVYLAEDGEPRLDIPLYIKQECGNEPPDFVIFMLGINDCFSVSPDDPQAIESRIDSMFTEAQTLLDAFREAAPEADLGICLTTPPNVRDEAFQANYKDRYHRWGWKRIQHRLVQRQIETFAGANDLFIIPTELYLDPLEGYPDNNAVHPNAAGYKQIAASIYASLKARLAAE